MLRALGIGANIKRLRKAAGYAQGQLADDLGWTQSQLSDVENKPGRVPELPTLVKIAKYLKVPIDTLIQGFDPDYDRLVTEVPRGRGTVGIEEQVSNQGALVAVDAPDGNRIEVSTEVEGPLGAVVGALSKEVTRLRAQVRRLESLQQTAGARARTPNRDPSPKPGG